MKTKQFVRKSVNTLMSLFLIAAFSYGQGNFTQTGTATINNTGGLLVIKGTTANFGTQTSVVGTVDYARTTTSQTIATVSYANLTLTGTGTPGAALKVFPNATVQVSGNLTLTSITKGDVTARSGASAAIDYNGGGQSVAAIDYASLIFSAAGTKTFASGNTNIANNFTISAGTADATTNSSTITYDGAAAVAQSVAAINYHNLTIAANARTVTLAAATVGVRGSFSPDQTNVTYVTTGSTIDYNGTNATSTGAQTIAAFTYDGLTVSGARVGDVVTLASSGTIAINGAFNPTATFTTGSYDVTGSTVNYTGLTGQSIVGGTSFPSYNNLTISGSGSKSASGAIALTAAGVLNNSIIFDLVSNDLTFTAAPTNSGTVRFAGATNGKAVGSTSGIVEYYGAGAQTVAAETYFNLLFTNGAATTAEKTIAGSVTAANNLTVNSTGFLTVSGTLQVNNDLTNDGAITNTGSITVGL